MRATLLLSIPRSEESFIKKKIHRNRQHAPSAGIICFSWFSVPTLGRIASILKDFSKICSMAIEWCIHLCSELKDKTGIKLGVTEVDVAALQNGLNKWKRSGRILFFSWFGCIFRDRTAVDEPPCLLVAPFRASKIWFPTPRHRPKIEFWPASSAPPPHAILRPIPVTIFFYFLSTSWVVTLIMLTSSRM